MVLGRMEVKLGLDIDFTIGKEAHDAYHAKLHNAPVTNESSVQAHANFYVPVFTHQDTSKAEIGAVLAGIFALDAFLVNILPNGVRGIRVVMQNSCNNSYTYELEGNTMVRVLSN